MSGLLGVQLSRRLALAGLLALAVLVAPPASAPTLADRHTASTVRPLPPVANGDERFGIVQGIQAPDLAFQAGARWDRIIFPWSLIQQKGPDSWQEMYFSDAAIRAQAQRGVTMVGVMIYTPQWASINPTYGRPVDRPQGLQLAYDDRKNPWGQFVRKLATRHRGVVDNWIVWNEPDLFEPGLRYTWDGSYEEYFQLLKTAYLNIKEVNPQANVILGGFSYWWDKKYNRPPYLASLFEVMARDPDRERFDHYFDTVAVHVYNAPLNSYAVPLTMRRIMEARGIDKPIWIDESNAIPYGDPLNPVPYAPMAASLDQQAMYVVQSMALALAAGVDRYAIYKAIDESPENGSDLYGLVRNNGSLKPAYVAYQVATSYFQGTRSAIYSWPGSNEKPTPEEVDQLLNSVDGRAQFIWPAQVSQVALERGPRRTTVVWNNTPEDVTYQVPATARQAVLVNKAGETETIRARNGFYQVSLPGSTHNADKTDYSIYMIGGEPFIVDEQVAALPSDAVRSRIELVWPHGSTEVTDATRVNVTAQLLMPGAEADPVPCRYQPETVQLWRKQNGGPAQLVAIGGRRMAEVDGLRYPVWDFNDVNVEAAREEGRFYEFYVVVDGIQTHRESWVYGGPDSRDWTAPPVLPGRGCE